MRTRNCVEPMANHPAGWGTATTSDRNAFHNLLAFYHKQKRWADALQLMGQHRHHLAKENPSLITYAVDVLTDASGKGKGDAAWIRLLAEHIRNAGPDAETSAKLKALPLMSAACAVCCAAIADTSKTSRGWCRIVPSAWWSECSS